MTTLDDLSAVLWNDRRLWTFGDLATLIASAWTDGIPIGLDADVLWSDTPTPHLVISSDVHDVTFDDVGSAVWYLRGYVQSMQVADRDAPIE